MADVKISADPNLASPASGDLIPIVDISEPEATANKTITWSQVDHGSAGYALDSAVVHIAGAETVTGLKTFAADTNGDLTEYDLQIGDTADYGILRIGSGVIGRTSHTAADGAPTYNLNGAFFFQNSAGPVTGDIEFGFLDSSGLLRFGIPKSAIGNATYNPRSMLIAGPAIADSDVVTVGYWQGQGIFHNLTCDTATSGADLGVQNDLEVEGQIWVDNITESTTDAGVTIESVLLKDGSLNCGAFTSTGIDDNATEEALELDDWNLKLGKNSTNSFNILHRIQNGASLHLSGGNATNSGSNVEFYGGASGLANDIDFRAGSTLILKYDDSASSWDFKTNDITTTGNITGNVIEATDYLSIPDGTTLPVTATKGHIAHTVTQGLYLTGEGSTYDVTLLEKGQTVALGVLTGTTDIYMGGDLSSGNIDVTKDAAAAQVQVTSYGVNSQFIGQHANGTKALPTDTTEGALLVALSGQGYANSTFTSTTALVGAYANQNFSATAEGTHLRFATTPDDSTTRAEVMRITGDGNVGIGTDSPAFLLDVVDESGYAIAYTRYTGGTGAANLALIKSRGTEASPTTVVAGDFIGGVYASARGSTAVDTIGKMQFNAPSVSSDLISGEWTLELNDTAGVLQKRMVVDEDGNVGIGQTAPTTPLEVKRTDDGRILRLTAGTGASNLDITSLAGLTYIEPSTDSILFRTKSATATLRLGTNNLERMRITADGNVGIGTTSPVSLLNIYGADAGLTISHDTLNETASGHLDFTEDANAIGTATGYGFRIQHDGNGNTLEFQTGVQTTVTSRMTLTRDGNVGIGTTSPDTLLHVSRSGAPTYQAATSAGILGSFDGTAATNAYTMVRGDTDKKIGIRFGNPANNVLTQIAWDDLNERLEIGASAGADASSSPIMYMKGGNVGIGTDTPEYPLHAVDGLLVATDTWDGIYLRAAKATASAGGGINIQRSRGTISGPGQTLSGDYYGGIGAGGHTGSAFTGSTAFINFVAAEDQTAIANGSYMSFDTTPIGSTTKTERMRIDDDGNIGIGTDSPGSLLEVAGDLTTTMQTESATNRRINFGDGTTNAAGLCQAVDGSYLWLAGGNVFGSGANIRLQGGTSGTAGDVRFAGQADAVRSGAENVFLNYDHSQKTLTTGSDGTATKIVLAAMGATSEGGEITLNGAASYTDWTMDTYNDVLRIRTVSAANNQLQLFNNGAGDFNVQLRGPLFLQERASAWTDAAGYGQIWVKSDTPNTLWFTDDAGNDGLVAAVAAYTVATLPSGQLGQIARVTDANTAGKQLGDTVAGSGSTAVLVWYNGSNWTMIGW